MATCLSEAALKLAEAGHPILPLHSVTMDGCTCGRRGCSRPGKHPRGVYGLKHATTDPRQIESWWHGQPETNVGMRCDRLVVFDEDGPAGRRSLEQLEQTELGELPETLSQRTRRGRHSLYSTPDGVLLGNSTATLGHPEKLDLRAGDRGYIVAAPSLPNYRWIDRDVPIAPLPEPWLERLLELHALPPSRPTAGGVGGSVKGRREQIHQQVAGSESTSYGLAALESEMLKVRTAPEHTRNWQLNASVFKLAQLVAGGELSLELLEREAVRAAEANGYLAEEGWVRVDAVIAYAISAGWTQPRRRKPRR
jgi:hypothetical protein